MTVPAARVHVVLGWGRSGSTLLASLLGRDDRVFNAGELRWLWQRGLVENRRCGCGEPVPSCPVWRGVLERMEQDDPRSVDPSHVLPLQQKYAVVRRTPRLLLTRPDAGRRRYAQVLRTLVTAITAETGTNIVVDSSKRPCDARLLQEAELEVDVTLLVRDPRAVAYSWSRPRSRGDRPDDATDLMAQVSPARSTFRWAQRNVLAELVLATTHPDQRRRLTYESLVADPAAALASVLPPAAGSTAPPAQGPVDFGIQHTVSGNPSRFRTGPVEIRRDDRWVSGLARRDRLVTTALAWPFMLAYGYRPATW